MSDLAIEIEEMYNSGFSPLSISAILEVPISWVYEVLDCSEKTTEKTADFS